LIGNIDYEDRSFSELEVATFKQIRSIYGNINLYKVHVSSLYMFSAIERIISFNDTFAAIALESMPDLESIELPNLRAAYSPSTFNIDLYDCPKVRVTEKYCSDMRSILGNMVSIGDMTCAIIFHEWHWNDGCSPQHQERIGGGRHYHRHCQPPIRSRFAKGDTDFNRESGSYHQLEPCDNTRMYPIDSRQSPPTLRVEEY
uniref:Recep_L_domain domain-containing protein n=1 Tax=Heligmosomoides polygyrus TaxID=6339 RepID=A0A183GS34_HELPZ